MRDDGGGGGTTSNQPADWTNSYTPLNVDVSDLRDFWREMMTDVLPHAMTSTSTVLAPMGEMIGSGLLGMGGKLDPKAGVFPEAVVVADLMTNAQARFRAFFHDVGNGIQCIADAAGVISEIYGNSDAANGASLNDVLFAFNDPLADRPKDLPKDAKTQSFSAQQAAAAAASGQNAMALTASDAQATQVIHPASGVTIYFFADGSSKTITTGSDSNSWAAGTTTTTSYYFNGKQVGTTTQRQYNVRGGYSYTTTSTSPTGDPNAPGSSSTQVVNNPDGSQTITTTTVDAKGKAVTSNPVTVQPTPSNDNSGDQGPVEAAENKYKTSGDKDYVQQHGSGF